METSEFEETPLQEWISAQVIRDEMLWKGSFGQQVAFFRDNVTQMFCAGIDYEDNHGVATVISTHRSKSIILPVYKLHRPGITMVARNNFYNWKLSVISDRRIDADFAGLFHTDPPLEPGYTGNDLSPVYFEGFPPEYIFGCYDESNKKKFSANLWGDHALWTTVFLILRDLGIVKPLEWHTAKSHREELDAAEMRKKARDAVKAGAAP